MFDQTLRKSNIFGQKRLSLSQFRQKKDIAQYHENALGTPWKPWLPQEMDNGERLWYLCSLPFSSFRFNKNNKKPEQRCAKIHKSGLRFFFFRPQTMENRTSSFFFWKTPWATQLLAASSKPFMGSGLRNLWRVSTWLIDSQVHNQEWYVSCGPLCPIASPQVSHNAIIKAI